MADWEEVFGELWGGTIEDLRLHLPLHRAVLTVRTTKDKVTSWYELQFEAVNCLVFADDKHVSWREAWLEKATRRTENGTAYINLNVSEVENALEITCARANMIWLGTEESEQ